MITQTNELIKAFRNVGELLCYYDCADDDTTIPSTSPVMATLATIALPKLRLHYYTLLKVHYLTCT